MFPSRSDFVPTDRATAISIQARKHGIVDLIRRYGAVAVRILSEKLVTHLGVTLTRTGDHLGLLLLKVCIEFLRRDNAVAIAVELSDSIFRW